MPEPSECYFTIFTDKDTRNMADGCCSASVVPKEFFYFRGYLSDKFWQSPDNWWNNDGCIFHSYDVMTDEVAHQDLLNQGYIYSPELADFMEKDGNKVHRPSP